MKSPRDYQILKANEACDVLAEHGFVYIAAQVRTGKTVMSMECAKLFGAKRVLFLTKKKAMQSIIDDYNDFGYSEHFDIEVLNDESMHKSEMQDPDLVIHDEHHRFGALCKPGKATVMFKNSYSSKPQIWLSGTPTPENYSQVYHQFWVTDYSPFKNYRNFYAWAKDYIDVKQKKINSFLMNDYTHAREEEIMSVIKKYMITFSQKEAGFTSEPTEEVLYVTMSDKTYSIANKLMRDLVVEGNNDSIVADTAVKLRQKLHQIYSGTIKLESGNAVTIDKTKAEFIKSRFANRKIGIFYVFKQELSVLKEVFGDELTDNIDEFKSTDKSIALQIVSGREGISLKEADYLVMYNISDSATSYWQGRDRLSTMDREKNEVVWIFSKDGIEDKIFRSVKKKKSYTTSYFKRDYKQLTIFNK